MKLLKSLRKFIKITMIGLTIGLIIVSYASHKNYQEISHLSIDLVKNQKSNINTECNFDSAYSNYLTDLSYKYYREGEDDFVEVTGRKDFEEHEKICTYKMIFLIDTERGKCKLYKAFEDEHEINKVQALKHKIYAYSRY